MSVRDSVCCAVISVLHVQYFLIYFSWWYVVFSLCTLSGVKIVENSFQTTGKSQPFSCGSCKKRDRDRAEKSNQNYKRTERSERLKAHKKTWSATAAFEDRKKTRSQRVRAASRHWKQPLATETSVLQLNATEWPMTWTQVHPVSRKEQSPANIRALPETSDHRNYEIINVCCLKPLSLW